MKTQTLKSIFSFCILYFAFCIHSNAQIVYTDVNPDQTFTANNSVYHLDINNDGTTDFDISIETGNISAHNYARIKISTLDTNNGVISGLPALSINSLIDSTRNWSSNTIIMGNDYWAYQHIFMWGHWHWAWLHHLSGSWLNATDKYLGLKFYSGGNIYYGWVRLNTLVTSNATANFTIKDYAYDSIPNQAILAGQKWSFIYGTGITSICGGDSTTLAVSGGASYLWNTGDTTASITVSPLTTTTYFVTFYDSVLASSVSLIQQVIVNSVNASIIQTHDSLIAVGGNSSSAYQWIDCATNLQIAGANSNIFIPLTASNYAVTISKNGCSGTSACYIYPPPSILNSNSPQCPGDSITLLASGGTSYLWNTGETTASITATPLTNTNYSVIVSDSSIGYSISLNLLVTVLPTVNASIFQYPANDTLFASMWSGVTFQWLDCNTQLPIPGAINYFYVPQSSGSYAVIINNGCPATSACYAYSTVGVNENENLYQFSISPNPATNSVFIKFPNNKTGEVSIVNLFGQTIFFEKINTEQRKIDVSRFPAGMYLVRWISDEKYAAKIFSVIK